MRQEIDLNIILKQIKNTIVEKLTITDDCDNKTITNDLCIDDIAKIIKNKKTICRDEIRVINQKENKILEQYIRIRKLTKEIMDI